MSHYFTEDKNLKNKDSKYLIKYYFKGTNFTFTSEAGIFSKNHIDEASDLLIRIIPTPQKGSMLLDMGCGYGCIGIVMAKIYDLQLTQADINPAAVKLAEKNCIDNDIKSEIFISDGFEKIEKKFDIITINPPIHAGKKIIYDMFEKSYGHLNENGKLYIVTLKKHGAESTVVKLREIFDNCEVLYKKNGYYIICCLMM